MATLDQIAKAIKKLGSADKLPSVPAVAKELGEDLSGSFVGQVYEAEPKAYPELKVAATQKGVTDARKAGLRFERIAARSGLSVGEVRDFAEKAGVGADFYVGRGRKPGSNGASASTAKSSGTSGRRGKAKSENGEAKGTSGRRGRKTGTASKKTETAKPRGRRGTRAAANPK